jgi:acyl carrier protein
MTDKPTKDEIEQWLGRWLANVLGPDARSIDPGESFFNYGVDSLAAVQLMAQLNDWLGADVSIETIFDYPSIRELAEFLTTSEKSSSC